MSMPPRIAVLGAGSWGTALAILLARNGAMVSLWARDAAQATTMQATRRNPRYLPDAVLPEQLVVGSDLAAAVARCDLVLVVTPSHAFAEVVDELVAHKPPQAGVAWATKGFDPASGRFLHEVAASRLPAGTPLAVVTGPSFAKEVAAGLPTAVTVHSDDAAFAERVAALLHSSHFRAYTGGDVVGAELGGAMKNVLAVATGVADGMQLGLNARAGLITRGLNEMLRLTAALGGQPVTIMGLAGVGDLVLTCTGDLSRNRRVGLALAKGHPLERILADLGHVAEGVNTAREARRLAERHGVDMPISEAVCRLLDGEIDARTAAETLLRRDPRTEAE